MPSFDEWVIFTFDPEARPGMQTVGVYPGSPEELLHHCLHFFETAPQVLKKLSHSVAERALSELCSINGQLGVLSHPSISFATRAQLAESHYQLFANVFQFDSYGSAAFMWWESLAGAEYQGGPPVIDDKPICLRLIATIEKILLIPSKTCQMSALHGLNEIGYPSHVGIKAVIDGFLRENRNIDAEVQRYASAVMSGRAP